MLLRNEPGNLLQTQGKHRVKGFLIYHRTKRWWKHVLGDYAHVSIMVRSGDHWIWMDPSTGFTHLQVFPVGYRWTEILDDVTAYQPFSVWRKAEQIRAWYGIAPFNCIEQAKAVLGIRSLWVQTPRQLKRYVEART